MAPEALVPLAFAVALAVLIVLVGEKRRMASEEREAKQQREADALEEQWRLNGQRGPHSEYWTDRGGE